MVYDNALGEDDQGKFNLPVYIIKHQAMKSYEAAQV